jgi:glutamyl-tRNA synthetase
MRELLPALAAVEPWEDAALEAACRARAGELGVPFGKLAQGLRAALTGTAVSPGLFEVMRALGREEALGRIGDAAAAGAGGAAAAA